MATESTPADPASPLRQRAVRRSPIGLAARILQRALVNFVEDRCTQHAAAISYFALFALFPLALLVTAVFGIVLRRDTFEARVLDALVRSMPIDAPNVAEALRALANLGPTLSVVSFLAAVWISMALATAVRSALEVVFDVDRGRPYFMAKVFDYVIVLAAGALFLASAVATTAWRVVQAQADNRLGGVDEGFGRAWGWAWDLGGYVLPAVLTFFTFLLLYRALPHRATRLLHIWPGALFAAVAFELAKGGFTAYITSVSGYQLVYGSLGGVIALLFWIYVSANILLFGAEIAAEFGYVVRGDPRRGHVAAPEGDWRRALLTFLRGLVFAPPGDRRDRR